MKLSIIIPAYNAAKFIQNAVKSIQMQSFNDYEIIIVNDGSTDNTALICEELQKNDSRIVFIQKENSGVSSTRNVGIKAALGEWITFLDADDEFQPNAFQFFEQKLEDVDIVIGGYNREKLSGVESGSLKVVDKVLIEKGVLRYVRYKKRLQKEASVGLYNNWASWGKFFRRTLLLDNNILFPTNLVLSEDTIFCFKTYYYARKIFALNQIVYYYQLNMGSAIKVNYAQKIIKNNIQLFDRIFAMREECERTSSWEREYGALVVWKLIDIIFALRQDNTMSEQEKNEYFEKIIKDKKIQKSIQKAPIFYLVNGRVKSVKFGWILFKLKIGCYKGLF